jgi:hypothetical protein
MVRDYQSASSTQEASAVFGKGLNHMKIAFSSEYPHPLTGNLSE